MNELKRYELSANPFETFETWFKKAETKEENPTAFTLATADEHGVPSARILLYKGHDRAQGFKFYTHSSSPKGRDLSANPQASMVFYWPCSEKQVRISGEVHKLSQAESEAYFYSRDRESQIASWLSNQSHPIASRDELEKLFEEAKMKFSQKEKVDFPLNWSGYYLSPKNFEFFVYGAHRLNDRFLYELSASDDWEITRLQP